RRLEALPIVYTEHEQRIRTLLDKYIETREKNSDGVRTVDRFIHQLLRKRLSSSPAAFSVTLQRHITTIEGLVVRQSTSRKLDDRILRRTISKTEEDYADDNERELAEADAISE